MDRIDFDQIKREYPLDHFAAAHLPGFKVTGSTVAKAVCPFHDDDHTNPNLEIRFGAHRYAGTYKCWRCDERGDIIDLAQRIFNVEGSIDAARAIIGKQSLSDEQRQRFAQQAEAAQRRRDATPRLNLDLTDFAVAAHHHIHDHGLNATRTLISRGLGKAIDLLFLGSTEGDFSSALLPERYDPERELTRRDRLFLNRIVIPYIKPGGVVTFVNARAIGDHKIKYAKAQQAVNEPYLLDMAVAQGHEDVCMLEGELDAASILVSIEDDPVGAFAIPGVHCFDDAAAQKLEGRRVWVIMDNDAAGEQVRPKIDDLLLLYAREINHLRLPPEFSDVNDMLMQRGRSFVRGWLRGAMTDVLMSRRRRVTRQ